MGYLHDVSLSRFISPFECGYNGGAWTPTIAANMISNVRTAADSVFTILIPILLPSNGIASRGAYLESIDAYYVIATDVLTIVDRLDIDKITLGVDGAACAGEQVPVSMDSGHTSNNARRDVEDHTMTATLTTPVWVDSSECFVGSIYCNAGILGPVFSFIGARANYTLRI